jgi:hypothetical protein
MDGVEKFWLVEFGSNLGGFGNGVAVLESGGIFAGDSGYYYTGSYDISNHRMNAKIKVIRHNNAFASIFGNADTFELQFVDQNIEGGLDGKVINGTVVGRPDLSVAVRFKKIAELP